MNKGTEKHKVLHMCFKIYLGTHLNKYLLTISHHGNRVFLFHNQVPFDIEEYFAALYPVKKRAVFFHI